MNAGSSRSDRETDRRGGNRIGDSQGRELLKHYLDGSGDEFNRECGAYMTADNKYTQNSKYIEKLKGLLIASAKKRLSLKGSENISWEGHLELGQDESVTGYSYLHGTNDFKFDGTITCAGKANGKTKFIFDINYTWSNDINKNSNYMTDNIKNLWAETWTLGKAKSYKDNINWSEKSSLIIDSAGDEPVLEGWPLMNN